MARPRHVMDQLGHTDPKFTLHVYARGMRVSARVMRDALRSARYTGLPPRCGDLTAGRSR